MRLRRRPGRPVPPHMDEVYGDLHCLTELVLLMGEEASNDWQRRKPRISDLRAHLRGRLAAQEKELEVGPPPES